MATIITSEIFRNRLLADGRRRIRYRYVIEDNASATQEYFIGPFHRPGAWDVAGNLSVYGSALLDQLKDDEDSQAEEIKATDALTFTQNPKFSTEKRIAKKLIRWMMREKDPRIVLWLEPLLTHLDENYTNTQLSNFLDLTIPQLAKMKRRINAILEQPASRKTCKELIAEFDDEEDVFE